MLGACVSEGCSAVFPSECAWCNGSVMTIETVTRMDELPSLSFSSKYSSRTQSAAYIPEGSGTGHVGKYEAVSRAVSGGALACAICHQHFSEEHLLRLHQKVAHSGATSLHSILLASGSSMELQHADGQHQHKLNNFSGHCTRNQKRLYRAFAQTKARQGLKRLPKWDDSRPVHAHWVSKRPRTASPEPHPSCTMSKESFMSGCGLVSKVSAVSMHGEGHGGGEVDVECQIVAVEGPVCGESLMSPRTTRSLMSQLSRDNPEAVRKRLSFCLDSEDQDASDNESIDSAATRRSVQVSLLAIDFSSPLGLRLKKHMKGDLVVPPITDIEHYCLTVPVLDEMAAKLRQRVSDYPIMHRKRKGIVTGYCHSFKFNSAERREFLRTLKTGLNARSRRLLRQTKKSCVRLTRLRSEIIRYWTIKKRTIVHEEIEIDDDLSIVQVDVPEHLFKAVQKLAVPSHQHHREGKYSQLAYTHQGMATAGRQHPGHSQRSHLSYPCSSSSSSGPVPQFLVKQVSKNWTENGQESQKLVFVPLEEAGPSQHSNLAVRNMPASSTQRSFSSTAARIKALPKHLRPCPKSRRKQLLAEREDSGEDFVIETASSSSDEEYGSGKRSKPAPDTAIYPLSMSRARDGASSSSWMMQDKPVPQMLHIANSTSAGMPVSGLMPFPTGMVPVSPWEHHISDSLVSHQVPGTSEHLTHATSSLAQLPELQNHLSIFGLPPSSLSKPADDDVDTRARTTDSLAHLGVGSSHKVTDHLKHPPGSSSRLAPALHQPNFLQIPPEPARLCDSNLRDSQSRPQPGSQRNLPDKTTGSMPRLSYGPRQVGAHPTTSISPSMQQQTLGRSSMSTHHPSILRGAGKVHGLPAPVSANHSVAAKLTGMDSKPSNKVLSSSDWTVVRASDDDVVEVICIDDD